MNDPLTDQEIAILRKGKSEEFWRLICRELERRVKKLTDDVMDELIDPDEERRKKYKASAYKSLMDLPDRIIQESETPPQEKKKDPSDPYE